MNMKMVFMAVAAMVMVACGGSQTHGGEAEALSAPVDSLVKTAEATKTEVKAKRKTPNLWTANAVEVRIRGCFAEVNRMAAGDGIDVGLLDNKYCSKDFLELKRNLEKKIQKGEVMFDGDEGYHWTADLGTPFVVDSVKAELLTRDQAQAEVWLKDEHDRRGYLELALYLEDGTWKIHNWIDDNVYPFGALFNWMQSVYDGDADDEEKVEEEE